MKREKLILLAAMLGLTLTACGNPKETSGTTPGSTGADRNFEGTTEDNTREIPSETPLETENLPASQEYISENGAYRIILLEGLTQTDMEIPPGTTMIELSNETERTGFSCIFLGGSKVNIPGNPDDIESLADYADYITDLCLDGTGMTVSWEDTDAPSSAGADQCLARKGEARIGLSRGLAYGYYVESANCYLAMIIIGNNDDVEEAMQVISLEVSDEAVGQSGTVDFINGMTAVLDSVNGANLRETFKMLADMGSGEEDLEMLAVQARQALSGSWGIEDAADLADMADWLMNEGHNQEALTLLQEYGGTDAADRNAFAAALGEQNADEETQIYLLAAYDAWAAYGEGAIAAWDLSRVGTIMSFGYAAGYCTYEEAMDKILEAAEKAQQLYGSWEDFNRSYLYGYSYWAEESLDDPNSSAAERAELVSGMEAQANGPFSTDWNMELKKEW
ncbi:MAG: DUF1266 domain-containing protein [Butyrivibrio sp.]|nr:DUF1266 domain-containing protein [Acetatifactor muris]MCM1557985.1 DUF1266 domain-containing protein [Butyrivibrio sp.]